MHLPHLAGICLSLLGMTLYGWCTSQASPAADANYAPLQSNDEADGKHDIEDHGEIKK